MTWFTDELGITQNAISSGTFDPQGINYTTFGQSKIISAAPDYSIPVKTTSFTQGNSGLWGDTAQSLQLPSYSGSDYFTSGANAANTPQSQWPTDPGNEISILKGNKFNNALNTPGNFVDTVTGKPLGTSTIDWNKIGDFFNRSALIFIGLVCLAGAIYLLAKENDLIPKHVPIPA